MKICYIGIDNGKQGAIAIIDENRKILDLFKYDESKPCLLYEHLQKYKDYTKYAFLEKPIVVHGLAHQTAPFELVGRHKMTLDICNVAYSLGDPLGSSKNNWKSHLGNGVLQKCQEISKEKSEQSKNARKRMKEILSVAAQKGYNTDNIKKAKKSFKCAIEQSLHDEYRELNKLVGTNKDSGRKEIKQLSLDTCLKLFPDSLELLKKNRTENLDDDKAEALLLAEVARIVYGKH